MSVGRELDSSRTHIHGNDDDVDGQQLPYHIPSVWSRKDFEQGDSLPDVDTGYGQFLNSKTGDLDMLNIEIAGSPGRRSSIS